MIVLTIFSIFLLTISLNGNGAFAQSTFWSGPFIELPSNTTVPPLHYPLSLGIQYPRPLCGATRVIQFKYEIPQDGLYTFSAADPAATCTDPVMILRDEDLTDWNWCHYTLYDKRPEVSDAFTNGTVVYVAVGGFEDKCSENQTVSMAVTFGENGGEYEGNGTTVAPSDGNGGEYESNGTTWTPSIPSPTPTTIEPATTEAPSLRTSDSPTSAVSDAPTTEATTDAPSLPQR